MEVQPTTIKTYNKPLALHQQMSPLEQRVLQHQKQAATAIMTRRVQTGSVTTAAATTILETTILIAAQMEIPIHHHGAP